jgi:hypothetical protein
VGKFFFLVFGVFCSAEGEEGDETLKTNSVFAFERRSVTAKSFKNEREAKAFFADLDCDILAA